MAADHPDYLASPAHPRIVDGKPSKNPRYLQLRPDLEEPRSTYLAQVGGNPGQFGLPVAAFPLMVQHVLPSGVRGIVVAGLLMRDLGFTPEQLKCLDPKIESIDEIDVFTLRDDYWSPAEPAEGAAFASLPPEAAQPRSYDRWGKEVVRWIQAEHPITLFESKAHKVVSRPGESERDFRMRLADLGREARDAAADSASVSWRFFR
mgnify:CR=1 FL=1